MSCTGLATQELATSSYISCYTGVGLHRGFDTGVVAQQLVS